MNNEPICQKARRLATEKLEQERLERDAWKIKFLTEILDGDISAATPKMVRDSIWGNTLSGYEICGYDWYIEMHNEEPLLSLALNEYFGVKLSYQCARSTVGLGKALLCLDKQVAEIKAEHPVGVIGWLKRFWDSL